MENIIICTWGISPTYRRRVKLNIQKAIDTGYDKIIPYIILTDDPSDFYELQDKTKKIVDIIDIHETRAKYSPWSESVEYISREKDEEKYGKDFVYNRDKLGKRFSYGLHRFYLPRVSELGYNRFVHNDPDHDIRYDKIVSGEITEEYFWNEFNTPINTMKGGELTTYTPEQTWGNVMINISNILRYEMKKRHSEYKYQIQYIFNKFVFTEGPFRYYHLENADDVLKYFLYWDEVAEINLTENGLVDCSKGTSAGMYLDYAMWAVVNDMMKITPMNFGRTCQSLNIFWSDRYFCPSPLSYTFPDGRFLDVLPGKTKEDFLTINKELLDIVDKLGWFHDQWPD